MKEPLWGERFVFWNENETKCFLAGSGARERNKERRFQQLNIDLKFQDWALVLQRANVRQYDDRAHTLRVTGDLPAGWRWTMYLSVFSEAYFNAVALTESDGALTAVLTREDLAFGDAVYTLQLVGEREGLTRHTNPVRLTVGASISGDARWPEVPRSFTAAQRAVEAAAAAAAAAAQRAEEAASGGAGEVSRTEFLALHEQADHTGATLAAHLNDASVHVSGQERASWDEAYDFAMDHGRDAVSHITAAERAAWNAKADASAIPTQVSALTNDAGYVTAQQRVAMTAATAALEPNRLYVWGETASLTITLAAPADSTIVNEYHFIFASGATPTTLTIPAAVKTPDGFTVDANMVYEVSILEGCMTAMSWAVSA